MRTTTKDEILDCSTFISNIRCFLVKRRKYYIKKRTASSSIVIVVLLIIIIMIKIYYRLTQIFAQTVLDHFSD